MKVISGGQRGVDRIGLEVAREAGIPTGGTAPKDYWTENGSDPTLKDFGLTEDLVKGYLPRTIKNVVDSDGTVLFGNMGSVGSLRTVDYCIKYKKPHICNPTAASLRDFLFNHKIEVLNVAGNRASKLSEVKMEAYRTTLALAFVYWQHPNLRIQL